ncbi:hypothetical protein ACFPM3_30265 [Streptomyces coeruleoprunus]|uniref:Uncharacterized protein n=1 Tax=Streptomyces coeruleoprunus TaxID=285563 RepID=A0ABV9XQ96_9ACTN
MERERQQHGFHHIGDGVEVDVRLAVIEYGDVLADYTAAATCEDAPRAVVENYALAVDALALARRVPVEDVPAVLGVGVRALRRVHRALRR